MPNEPNKYRVKRANADHVKLTVKLKSTGEVLDKLNVWVTWCNLEFDQASTASLIRANLIQTPSGATGPGTLIRTIWNFTANITPTKIVDSTQDIPDLTGAPVSKVPNYNASHLNDGAPFGQPSYKWDISRQWRLRLMTPTLGANDFTVVGGNFYDNTPNANLIQPTTPSAGPDAFPSSKVEGNDDSGDNIESNNPYSAATPAKLTDSDPPALPLVLDKAGPVNTIVETRVHFKEFVRLEINGKWYLVSEQKTWRLHSKLKKIWNNGDDLDHNGQASAIPGGFFEGHYTDNGSISDASNADW